MTATPRTGSEIVCDTLEAAGVRCVFGVPGTQNVALFEALRRSAIRTVLATHELGAAFMANGYYRASGRLGVLVTIPGPGFTNALTGLAEARHDSAAVLHVTGQPQHSPSERFQLQHIDQAAIAGTLAKRVFEVDRAADIRGVVAEACALAQAGEPGPVIVQIAPDAIAGSAPAAALGAVRASQPAAADAGLLDAAAARLAAARRPVLFAGQGVAGAAAGMLQLVERCRIPVLTTSSGRGVIPEDHPFAFGFESHRGDVAAVNALLETADLILAVGCRLTHNGTVGFQLGLPPDRLVRVNSDDVPYGTHYPASLAIHVSAEALVKHLLRALGPGHQGASTWDATEVGRWRRRLQAPPPAPRDPEPVLQGSEGGTAAAFFAALRRALPRDGVVVTDSGLHQGLTRRYFEVLVPRGLILPSDFQSMGFGVAAAIGAQLAAPAQPVVAVVGDGGFLMSGMELVTAVREDVPVTVVVFNDGHLNQIRLQQFREFGRAHATELGTLDLEALAAALSLRYVRLTGDAEGTLRAAIASRQPTLVEVVVGDSPAIRMLRAKGLGRETARGLIGPRILNWLKRALGYGR